MNTSFNVRGEPIVCTPEDAYRCFLATDMDVLVLEDVVLTKDAVDQQAGEANASDTSPSSSSIERCARCKTLCCKKDRIDCRIKMNERARPGSDAGPPLPCHGAARSADES